ncbi:hypothetical protein [Promicromonospora sp. NPDC090134]|uniref:hypothetical protein n=1 Tax=Promicromonospora sp. NPDC090134 TaxID=3364408 RepID=UPI0038080F95
MSAVGKPRQVVRTSRAPALEVAAAVLIPIGVLILAGNWLAASACFIHACGTPEPGNYVTYAVVAPLVAAAVVWTFISAWRREASWIYLWHGPMGLVALAVTILCAVPSFEVTSPDVEPEHTPWTGCVEYSGGDSDCPGG